MHPQVPTNRRASVRLQPKENMASAAWNGEECMVTGTPFLRRTRNGIPGMAQSAVPRYGPGMGTKVIFSRGMEWHTK